MTPINFLVQSGGRMAIAFAASATMMSFIFSSFTFA